MLDYILNVNVGIRVYVLIPNKYIFICTKYTFSEE